MEVRNFLFHRVSDEQDYFWPPMKVSLFETIIRYIKSRYQVVLAEDFLDQLPLHSPRKKKIATIQFDDGYKDNIENAVPILKKYDCPASFYVVSDCIDTGIPTWTYLLDHALQHTDNRMIRLEFDFVPIEYQKIILEKERKSGVNIRWIKPWLKRISNGQRMKIVESILDQCQDVTFAKASMMNWGDINQLMQQGFYIGSHTKSHPLLASMETEKEIYNELAASSDRIEEMTGRKPSTISYPIGSFDERVIKLAKECGYRYGMAVEHRFYNTINESVMAIPRVELYQEPKWKAFSRITGLVQSINKYVGK